MIDLHMHTIYSDGDKTIKEVLKLCEDKKLEYISITDHDACKQYEDKDLSNNDIFTGKIIKGIELTAYFNNKHIEILAYNIKDLNVLDKWLDKYYSKEKIKEQREYQYNTFLKNCDKKGLIYNEEDIEQPKTIEQYREPFIYQELLRHKENYEILGELATSFSNMYRNGIANPNSDYYIDESMFSPQYKEVIDIIHKAGGLAFLAHPFEYKFEDTIKFIDDLRKEIELDGIECFHPSSVDDNKKDILVEYAKNNNLYISGGSDYHGNVKPDIEVGIGRGNLNISKEYIEDWVNL